MNLPNRMLKCLIPVMALLISNVAVAAVQADVRVQLSSQEAYVGMPIQMYIQITGSSADTPPELPSVPGLEFELAGAPNRNTSIVSFNNRQTITRSTTYVVHVTPRRAGTFEIPAFEIKTDRGSEWTQPLRFSATVSETGDLMFVEIIGQTDQVYVGQSVDVTLEIWLKPFVDPELKVKLSAANMWSMISMNQSEWGGFRETLEDLASRRRTIRGRETVREDRDGVEQEYYVYEIDATIYPLTPGKLEAKNVQIVAQYPTKLGRSRDPFASMFSNDDFFRRSGFSARRSLTVTSARPIMVEPSVSSVNVQPIPTMGRPSDYRGAVGRYGVVTQASPLEVKAGDPITLQIGIRGTGPMELVQSPPLAKLSALTDEFKVSDEPLAGFVQDDVKIFSTSIRPRREGIAQIPAIPFSYFDPVAESFETVFSDPIAIKVTAANLLSLDSIVGQANRQPSDTPDSQSENSVALDNYVGASVIGAQGSDWNNRFFPWFLLVPPALLAVFLIVKHRVKLFPVTRYRLLIRQIDSATHAGTIAEAIRGYASEQRRGVLETDDHGTVRGLSIRDTTAVDKLCRDCDDVAFAGRQSQSLDGLKQRATSIAKSLARIKTQSAAPRFRLIQHPIPLFAAAVCIVVLAGAWLGSRPGPSQARTANEQLAVASLELTTTQKEVLLAEATEAYARGLEAKTTDIAEAQSWFAKSTQKYQLLVDSGIRNSKLFFNLANANLQIGEFGLAIVNYQRSENLDPTSANLQGNLIIANQLAKQKSGAAAPAETRTGWVTLRWYLDAIPATITTSVLVIAWLGVWGMLLIGSHKPSRIQRRGLAAFIIMLLIVGGSLAWSTSGNETPTAVVIVENVTMYSGCDETFSAISDGTLSEGQPVEVIQSRGEWIQVESSTGCIGWVKTAEVELV